MTFDEEIKSLIDIAIKAHLAGGMVKNNDGSFALTTDLVDAIKSAIKRQLPKRKHNAYSIGFNRCLTTIRKNMGIV